jgi:hypothetical protein
MAADVGGEWPSWLQNVGAALAAGLATLGVAHLNKRAALEKAEIDRKAKLDEAIDSRLKQILADDEKTIRRLSKKIDALEDYVRILIGALIRAGVTLPPMPKADDQAREEDAPPPT